MDLDVLSKRYSSDQIAYATCTKEYSVEKLRDIYLKKGPISLNPEDFNTDYSNLLLFNIFMSPPGGSIELYSKTYELLNQEKNNEE